MKINDIGANYFDQYVLSEGPFSAIKDWMTDASGDREFKDYKEGLKKDYLRWANLTQGIKGDQALNDIKTVKAWLTSQYGIKDAEMSALGQATQGQQEPAQAQAEPTQAQTEPQATEPAQAQQTPADNAQADKIKANVAANQQARQGGGNSMDLNKWYQDYQAEQNPNAKLNLVKELVNRVADYGPRDVESMKAILKKIRDPQNTPFINAALQKMSAGKDMAVNPQGTAKPAQAKPTAPGQPTASSQADAGKPGFMQSKLKGVQRGTAPAFTKQTVNNSVMYHVNAIVEALGYTLDQLGYTVLKESASTSTIYNRSMLTESQLMELDVPRQAGFLGRAAGAVGSTIGAAKGAWQGAKDAYQGSKALGQNQSRAHQAGNDLGASGEGGATTPGQQGQAGPAGSSTDLAGGGDLWDKVTRLMYNTGRLETNPQNNFLNKMGNYMLKGTGYTMDTTKGMRRGGFNDATVGTTQSTQKATPAQGGGTAATLASKFSGQGEQQPTQGNQQATPAQGSQPAATTPAGGAPAQSTQPGAEQPAEVTGTLDAKQLAAALPGVDAMGIARGIADIKAGKQVGAKQKQAFGDAMVALMKADPTTTGKVMASLAKMSAGQGASAQVGSKAPTSGFDAKGNATESAIDKRAKLMASKIFGKARLK